MKTRSASPARWIMVSALSLALLGCGGDASEAAGVGGSGGVGLADAPQVLPGLGFVASSFGFYYPDDPAAGLDGFDLDGRASSSDSPGADECTHDDWMGPNQESGIDYGFLRIIRNEALREDGKHVFGGFHEGQIVDGVIAGAVKNGSMTILLQVEGLDDSQNDEDVRVQVYSSEDSPALGTDNSVLLGATLGIHPDSRFHSGSVKGTVVDGVLVAGPLDLLFPIDIMIVRDELRIHDSWLRVELLEDGFEGTVSGYWDVSNIRDIIGVPTTDNGNAANFTIGEFDAAMAELADGNYDDGSGLCASFSTMFRFSGVQAFVVSDSQSGHSGGTCDPADENAATPVDQCVNGADQAALDALATAELSGPAIVGMIAGDCPLSACSAELGGVLSDGSDAARTALGDCIARCISDETGLSTPCTGCYGSIAACSTGCCLQPCLPPNSGSQECATCALESCIDVNACTGLY